MAVIQGMRGLGTFLTKGIGLDRKVANNVIGEIGNLTKNMSEAERKNVFNYMQSKAGVSNWGGRNVSAVERNADMSQYQDIMSIDLGNGQNLGGTLFASNVNIGGAGTRAAAAAAKPTATSTLSPRERYKLQSRAERTARKEEAAQEEFLKAEGLNVGGRGAAPGTAPIKGEDWKNPHSANMAAEDANGIAYDDIRTVLDSGGKFSRQEIGVAGNVRRNNAAGGHAQYKPVEPSTPPAGQGTDAASTSVNAAEAEKTGGATTEATRDAATQVPTAAGGGTTGELSFNNYSRDAQAAIIKEQGKNYWGRSAQERFHLDSMDRRYSEINKMKAGEERNAAIERFNQDLQSGPGFNDYMNGNQVYGKAAGVGVTALTASAVMGDGRRSNAQLYSSPF